MKRNLTFAKNSIAALDKRRLERALLGTSETFQWVLAQLPLLLYYNHPNLPGYTPDAPFGIAHFSPTKEQTALLSAYGGTDRQTPPINPKSAVDFPPVLGMYAMGSFGSISQTLTSDLDIWVCGDDRLPPQEKNLLAEKLAAVEAWALSFDVEIHFYLMDQQRFRHRSHADPLSVENSGSAQYMLLLDEFYRSAIRLAGCPLLWLHLWVDDEREYETEVRRRIAEGGLDPSEWVDFGGLGQFSAKEYFGASLWQLNKAMNAPYKSVLKIVLLEAYSQEYPNTHLIAVQFKQEIFAGNTTPEHHFDPYLAVLAKVTQYLTALGDFTRLDFVRRCFYIKTTEDFALHHASHWRVDYMRTLAQDWGWNEAFLAELDNRPYWKIKRAQQSHDNVVRLLMLSYRNLVQFARKHNIHAGIAPQDMTFLTRKLCSSFEEQPGKVVLLSHQISYHLEEPDLTFIEVKNSHYFKAGWYVVNRPPSADIMFSAGRFIEYGETLNTVAAWAYFNHLLTPETHLHIFSQSVNLETLRKFVSDLRLSFPTIELGEDGKPPEKRSEIRSLLVAVNLSKDATKNKRVRTAITAGDLFSFGSENHSLIGSIDFTYLSAWHEIRTLHFEGQNAMLSALKELSNKIHRGEIPPVLQVFCYAKRYRKPLGELVDGLIKRYIRTKIIGRTPIRTNRLRMASKNWQLFFEGRQVLSAEDDNTESALPVATPKPPVEPVVTDRRHYPPEIDTFASEGFLQFFFEDNNDGSFNVYILDELNHLEIYRHCDGLKDDKIYGINQIYQSALLEERQNPYKVEQRDFNYPQFYQLTPHERGIQILPFQQRIHL